MKHPRAAPTNWNYTLWVGRTSWILFHLQLPKLPLQVFYQNCQVTESLSPLLKKGTLWKWTSTHEVAFLKARKSLSETHDLAFYDQNQSTALHVDAYRLFGLGFILNQTDAEGIAGEWSKQASGIYPKLNRAIRWNEQNWCQKGCFLRVWEHMFAWDAEKEI